MKSQSFLKRMLALFLAISCVTNLTAQETTVVIQEGLDGFAGTEDTRLSFWHHKHNFSKEKLLKSKKDRLNAIVKLKVMQSQGGDIPDGAEIVSATLSLYKKSAYNYTWNAKAIKTAWSGTETTWKFASNGVEWNTLGATGNGTDLRNNPDQLASIGWSQGWVDFDVTADVHNWSNGLDNNGWHIISIAGNNNIKRFVSSEGTDETLRPKLTVVYKAKNIILQNGVDGYAGNDDSSMYGWHTHLNYDTVIMKSRRFGFGGKTTRVAFTTIHKFDIFSSENGLIGDAAEILQAKFNIYKTGYYNYNYGMNRLLKDWDESLVTWDNATPGNPWSVGGAWGFGTDMEANTDGTGSVEWQPQWLNIDVTSGVKAFQAGQANYGWHLSEISGNENFKRFASSEYEDVALRPNLSVDFYLVESDKINPELPQE